MIHISRPAATSHNALDIAMLQKNVLIFLRFSDLRANLYHLANATVGTAP